MSCLPCSSLCQWSLCSGRSMLCESERRRTLVPPRPLPDTLNRKQEARQESAGFFIVHYFNISAEKEQAAWVNLALWVVLQTPSSSLSLSSPASQRPQLCELLQATTDFHCSCRLRLSAQ